MKSLGAGNFKHDWFATSVVSCESAAGAPAWCTKTEKGRRCRQPSRLRPPPLDVVSAGRADTQNDLSPRALSSHLKHLDSPAPLSASEKALLEVREAEAIEAKRTALDPENEARRKKAVVGLAGKMQLQDGVREALEKVGKRSDEGWITVLVSGSPAVESVWLVRS
jgi:hypothetical protein